MYGIYTKQLRDYLPKSSTKQPMTRTFNVQKDEVKLRVKLCN